MNNDFINHNLEKWTEISKVQEISSFPISQIEFQRFLAKESNILDYGCGKGRVLEYLKNTGFNHLTGCEPLSCLAETAREVHNNVDILHDPRKLPYPASYFDAVLLIAVLSSVIPKKERHDLIKRLRYITSDQGKMIVGDFGVSNEAIYIERYRKCKHIEPFTFETEDGIFIHHFGLGEIEELFTGLFAIEEVKITQAKSIHGRQLNALIIIANSI